MKARILVAGALTLTAPVAVSSVRAEASSDGELTAAQSLLESSRFEEARKEFERLAGRRGPACTECLLGLAEAQLRLGKPKDALKQCDRALGANIADPRLRARAHNMKALALLGDAGEKEKGLQKAEAELTLALEAAPNDAEILFNRGHVLLRQRRDSEGTADLQRFLELQPDGPVAERARRLIADPRRARERFLPEFTLLTLQGETLDPARLKGRIVLIDFWATWCAPCREAIPEIKALLRKYPGDRLLVVSISADQDEKAWRDFVARNAMVWPQFFDAGGRVRDLFGVNVFPTYLVVDGEGIVRGEIQGTDPGRSIAARLKTTLARFPELAER